MYWFVLCGFPCAAYDETSSVDFCIHCVYWHVSNLE